MFKPKLVLDQDEKDNKEYAEEILRNCGPCIASILRQYDKEVSHSNLKSASSQEGVFVQAARLGVRLADVEVHRDSGAFITCDRCSTSIADFHLCPLHLLR